MAEEWQVEILNPTTDGQFFLTFTNNNGDQYVLEDNISYSAEAWELNNALWADYYSKNIYTATTTTKTLYDVDDNVITATDMGTVARIVFNVKLEKRINGYSFSSVEITVFDSATGNTYYPAIRDDALLIAQDAVTSSAPLGGGFTLKCTDPETSTEYESREFSWAWQAKHIANSLQEDIPFLASAVVGFDGVADPSDDRWYWENYRKFHLEFVDYLGDVPQCTIQDSGSNPMTGNNVVMTATTRQEGGSAYWFEPIPSEMLATSITKP